MQKSLKKKTRQAELMCGHDKFQFFGPDATKIPASFFSAFSFNIGPLLYNIDFKSYGWIVSTISISQVTALHLNCILFSNLAFLHYSNYYGL